MKTWIIIVIVILILSLPIIIIYGLKQKNSDKSSSNTVENIQNRVSELEEEGSCCKIGPQGEIGEQGPAGPPGGTYLWKGPLRNMGYSSMVTDRLYSVGPQSVAYLNEQNFSSHQTWTLNSSQTLENQYGGCLYGDTTTNDVYMKSCNNPSSSSKWTYDKYGRIVNKNDTTKCLSVSPVNTFTGQSKIVKDKAGKTKTFYNFDKLKLTECETGVKNQKWTFY